MTSTAQARMEEVIAANPRIERIGLMVSRHHAITTKG